MADVQLQVDGRCSDLDDKSITKGRCLIVRILLLWWALSMLVLAVALLVSSVASQRTPGKRGREIGRFVQSSPMIHVGIIINNNDFPFHPAWVSLLLTSSWLSDQTPSPTTESCYRFHIRVGPCDIVCCLDKPLFQIPYNTAKVSVAGHARLLMAIMISLPKSGANSPSVCTWNSYLKKSKNHNIPVLFFGNYCNLSQTNGCIIISVTVVGYVRRWRRKLVP